MIIAAELMVDWLKHAFITKFNEISSQVYRGLFCYFFSNIIHRNSEICLIYFYENYVKNS